MHERIPLATLSPAYHSRRNQHPHRGRLILWLGGLALAAAIYWGVPAFFHWKHAISSSGGRYFVNRVVIPVPPFQQNDARWSFDLLGNSIDTLGQSGCAVTSTAMILSAYGVDTDPQRLNQYLTTHGGYVGDGWLVWEKAADLGLGQVKKAYEDDPSYALLDQNLLKGNPVIIRLTLRNGTKHFVVVVGKQGWDYLIRDPARPPAYGVYPLKNLTHRIEALRFYTIVPPPAVPVRPEAMPPPVAITPAPASDTPLSAPPSLTVPATTPPIKPNPAVTTPLPPFVYTNTANPVILVPSATKPKTKRKHKYTFPPMTTNAPAAVPAN